MTIEWGIIVSGIGLFVAMILIGTFGTMIHAAALVVIIAAWLGLIVWRVR